MRDDHWSTSEAAAADHERAQHDPREGNEGYDPDPEDELARARRYKDAR